MTLILMVLSGTLLPCLPPARGEIPAPVQLPPPPERLISPVNREVISRPVGEKTFSWTPVEKALIYHLEISIDEEFRVLILDAYPTSQSFTVKELPRGTFYWHISSINAEGLEGRFSSTSLFIYPSPPR